MVMSSQSGRDAAASHLVLIYFASAQRHAAAAASRSLSQLPPAAKRGMLAAMDDHSSPELRAKIAEAVAEADKLIRARRIRTSDEAVEFIKRWLATHAPNEVLDWQAERRRRLQVN
jgi:hypothetical protein